MKARLKNLMTGQVIDVHSTTDSPDSSYGLECWVDDDGNSYGQCQFGAPFGFELVEIDEGGSPAGEDQPTPYSLVYDHPLLRHYVPSAKTPHIEAMQAAGLLAELTPDQAAKVVIIAQTAYSQGQASMGAERIDTDAIWVNGVGMIEVVNGEWRLTTPDKPQKSQAAAALGGTKSEAKAAAARENGRRGGRPRKQE